jgi:hypothetical protein
LQLLILSVSIIFSTQDAHFLLLAQIRQENGGFAHDTGNFPGFALSKEPIDARCWQDAKKSR